MDAPHSKSLVQRALLSACWSYLLPLALFLLYPIGILIVVLPCIVYRLCNRLAAKIFRPDLDGITHVLSQFYISREARWSRHGFNIINGYVIKGRLNAESIVKLFETKVLQLREYKNLKAYPVRFGGYFYWKPVVDFNIRKHIRAYDGGVVSGNDPCSEEDLKRVLGDGLGSTWKVNQSLWELLILNKYYSSRNDGERDKEEKSVLILRIQHVMGDGISINGLMEKLCTGDSTISVASRYKGRSWTRLTAELVATPYFMCRYFRALSRRGSAEEQSIWKDGRGDGGSYLMTWTEGISAKRVSEVSKRFGVCFQAVINALASGATHKLLKELGHEPPKYLVVGHNRYLPGHPGGLANYSSPLAVNIPLGEMDAIRRVQICHKELTAVTEAASPELLYSQTNMLLHCCPVAEFLKPPKRAQKDGLKIAVTGCPGPRGPVFIDGKEMERLTPSVANIDPLGDAVIATYTSLGKMIVTVSVKKHFCPDPATLEKFNQFLLEEMQELLHAKPLETATVIEA